jgi:hypothetical protein
MTLGNEAAVRVQLHRVIARAPSPYLIAVTVHTDVV